MLNASGRASSREVDLVVLGCMAGWFLESIGLTLLDRQRSLGALTEASTQSIAMLVRDQPGLPIDDLQGALGARRDAQATAIAQIFVDSNYLSFGHETLLSGI
jgi:hypothetical protein